MGAPHVQVDRLLRRHAAPMGLYGAFALEAAPSAVQPAAGPETELSIVESMVESSAAIVVPRLLLPVILAKRRRHLTSAIETLVAFRQAADAEHSESDADGKVEPLARAANERV
jgi:hypothetical protein